MQQAHVTPLPPVRYQVDPSLSTCCPVDWQEVQAQIQGDLSSHSLEAAWRKWEIAYHSDLRSRCTEGPTSAPGKHWKMQRSYQDRITTRGEEGPQLRLLYATARRLLDYGKWGGHRSRTKVIISMLTPCSLISVYPVPWSTRLPILSLAPKTCSPGLRTFRNA